MADQLRSEQTVVGFVKELGGRLSVVRGRRRAERQRQAFGRERPVCAGYERGDLIAGQRGDDRKLVAADARDAVAAAGVLCDHLADALQRCVAGRVTVDVVDLCERVEVGEDERERPSGGAAPRELFVE